MWSGSCNQGGFDAHEARTSSYIRKQTTCSTDLCNNLEDLKYLEYAPLCSDGFYNYTHDMSNTNNNINDFKCYSSQYSLTSSNFVEMSCTGTNNYCIQYVNINLK